MGIGSIDVDHWLVLDIFNVSRVQNVTGSFLIATFLDMIVAWADSCESVFHLHFSIESSCHVSIRRKITI